MMNCVLCQLPLQLHWGICSQCYRHLPHYAVVCPRCSLPLVAPNTSCSACRQLSPNWQRLIAVADYQTPFIELISQFKVKRRVELSYALARLMFLAWYRERQMTGLPKPDIVTCVPLYRNRYWSRGYNQSALLAKHIAHWLGRQFQPYLLKCRAKRQDQKILSRRQRQHNVQHLFVCNSNLMHKTVMVIDDIVTTGATIHAVCQQLQQQGTLQIQILCLCRTTL